ncbi:MAG: UDP-2,4-diacetamido-2,4,6-trideoxy-beta-L-altropyranose hydrolase [Rikenellaceae bacterium]|jgi:UDP-2,4-diacetamido-2,4,6-trideoxy-beta-L-altropyranose hydrolase|nr:UDP-2,4-diacetamido-2,4,6-trideoxy-beta-L-altropyranose hydrolase [Rikenellaceae bacterium]
MAKKSKKTVFRADGNSSIGMGHFIRSLALAEQLKDEFFISFATRTPSDYQRAMMKAVCDEVIELPGDEEAHFDQFLGYLTGNETVVLDNYFFDTDYQLKVKALGCRLVCVDDTHNRHYAADVVINHALGLTRDMFSCEPYTQLCLGLDWALLRMPFLKHFPLPDRGDSLFVCFGGVDANNLTLKILQAVDQIGAIDTIYAVLGDAYSYKRKLKGYAQANPKVKIMENLSAAEIVSVMSSCRAAVVSASTVLWESVWMGLPCVYGCYVKNQEEICRNLGTDPSLGLICLGDLITADGQVIVDAVASLYGRDPNTFTRWPRTRVRENFQQLFRRSVTLRPAEAGDAMRYYLWANEPLTRANSGTTEPIPLDTHLDWFQRHLVDPDCTMYISYYQDFPLGQVRFDETGDAAEVSISMDEVFRGRHLGDELLLAALATHALEHSEIVRWTARIRIDNIPSRRIFEAAGFSENSIEGEFLQYTLERV